MGLLRRIKRGIKKIVRGIGKVASFLLGPISTPYQTTQSIAQTSAAAGPEMLDGTLLNFQGGSVPVPVVYGFRKIGGTRVFVSTNGTDNKYLFVAFVLAEGQCVGLSEELRSEHESPLYIDDTNVRLTSYSHGVVAEPVSGSPYADRLKVQFFDGRVDQVSASTNNGVFSNLDSSGGAAGWTDRHKLSGLCYYAMRFEWKKITTQTEANNNPYKGIPQIKVRLSGKMIFDPLEISSNHGRAMDGTDALRATQKASYLRDIYPQGQVGASTYTNNFRSTGRYMGDDPVAVLLDYLRNPDYGKGIDDDRIDFDSFKAAAILTANTDVQRLFTCPMVLDSSQTLMNNVKIILQSFRGFLPYANGKFKLVMEHTEDTSVSDPTSDFSGTEANVATKKTFTDDNIVGGITIERPDKASRFNRVRITYTDGIFHGASAEAVFPEDTSSSDYQGLLAEDNGEQLEGSFTIPWCTSETRAKLFAQLLLRRSRNNKAVTFATNLGASDLIPTDLITIQNDAFGIDGPFRIQEMTIGQDGLIVISAVEHEATIYDQDLNTFTQQQTAPVLNLPDPNLVQPPSGLTADSGQTQSLSDGTRRIKISFTASPDPFLEDHHIQIKKSSEPDFTTIAQTEDTEVFYGPVAVGDKFDIRVFARNEIGRSSDKIKITAHTIANTYTPASGSATTVTGNSVSASIGTAELGA